MDINETIAQLRLEHKPGHFIAETLRDAKVSLEEAQKALELAGYIVLIEPKEDVVVMQISSIPVRRGAIQYVRDQMLREPWPVVIWPHKPPTPEMAEWFRAAQRHHDHYVKLYLGGGLRPEDEAQFDLAMQREKDGLVMRL